MERVRVPLLTSLACAAALAAAPSLAAPITAAPAAAPASVGLPTSDPDGPTRMRRPGQTSDGVPGVQVGPSTASRARTRNEVTYDIVPGVTVREWDQVDGREPLGRVRLNLVSVDLDAPHVTFDHLGPRFVPNRKPTSTLALQNDAFMAVNGDFFDISDTGAPLGVAVSRDRGLLNGGRTGWIPENTSLWFNRLGPRMGPLSVQWSVKQFPRVPVSGVNQPTVPRGMVGVYTWAWGRTSGKSVTDGVRNVREVVIRRNRVIRNHKGVSVGRRIKRTDKVLIGVGRRGNARLKPLRKGRRVTFKRTLAGGGRIQTAITGDRPLLLGGVRQVVNDRIAHPRTAIGIDRDGHKLLFLVVDGRSTVSRGFTMVELADLMSSLGAEDALNLDGGGSSTMFARRADGTMGLVNEPSDGVERRVPNAFGLIHDGPLPPVEPPPTTP